MIIHNDTVSPTSILYPLSPPLHKTASNTDVVTLDSGKTYTLSRIKNYTHCQECGQELFHEEKEDGVCLPCIENDPGAA